MWKMDGGCSAEMSDSYLLSGKMTLIRLNYESFTIYIYVTSIR